MKLDIFSRKIVSLKFYCIYSFYRCLIVSFIIFHFVPEYYNSRVMNLTSFNLQMIHWILIGKVLMISKLGEEVTFSFTSFSCFLFDSYFFLYFYLLPLSLTLYFLSYCIVNIFHLPNI